MRHKAVRPATPPDDPVSSTSRLEAFSDGVFAIAITLLILDVKIPALGSIRSTQELIRALSVQWPAYIGYLLSFFVIGITWIDHHVLFNYILRVNRPMLVLNLLLLLTIAFVPFPTAILSNSLQQGIGEDVAAVLYSGTLFVMGLCFNALWLYSSRVGNLLDPTVDPAQVRQLTRRSLVWPLLYLVSMLLAPVSVWGSLVIYILVPVTFLVPNPTDRF